MAVISERLAVAVVVLRVTRDEFFQRFQKPAPVAIVAKVLIFLIGVGLALQSVEFLQYGPGWYAGLTLVLALAITATGVIGGPRRFFIVGFALINLHALLPHILMINRAVWRGWSGFTPQAFLHLLISVFVAIIYTFIWWIAARPIWNFDNIPPDPARDELPAIRGSLQLEVLVARILMTLITLGVFGLVFFAIWLATAFGSTESLWGWATAVSVYALAAGVTGYIRLPLGGRLGGLFLHGLLTLGLLIFMVWNLEEWGEKLKALVFVVGPSAFYALTWWVATSPKRPRPQEMTSSPAPPPAEPLPPPPWTDPSFDELPL